MNKEYEIKENLYDLYASYRHHKELFEYYMQHKNLKSQDEIKARIEYITKNKLKQNNEIDALMWVLGEVNEETN